MHSLDIESALIRMSYYKRQVVFAKGECFVKHVNMVGLVGLLFAYAILRIRLLAAQANREHGKHV